MTEDKIRYSHLIDLNDYPVEWWEHVINLGKTIYENPEKYAHELDGKIMGTLFYEPSTRTQMSFQTAMLKLGGTIIGFDNPSSSSVSKGENLKDTTKIVSSYADVLVIRHPLPGAAKAAALTADCPLINAGDGGHLHPTQTLTDMLTLKLEKGRLENLTIGLCGDLKFGRTVHSLVKAMSCFKGNKFVFFSTPELQIPSYIRDILDAGGIEYEEIDALEKGIDKLDVLYMTRIQRERFASEEEYFAQKDVYVLDRKKLMLSKPDLAILHPLPRVDEITVDVDSDSRACYFKQAKYGVFVRMALILTLLREKYYKPKLILGKEYKTVCCSNEKCITNFEHYLPKTFKGIGDNLECEFCNERTLLK